MGKKIIKKKKVVKKPRPVETQAEEEVNQGEERVEETEEEVEVEDNEEPQIPPALQKDANLAVKRPIRLPRKPGERGVDWARRMLAARKKR